MTTEEKYESLIDHLVGFIDEMCKDDTSKILINDWKNLHVQNG